MSRPMTNPMNREEIVTLVQEYANQTSRVPSQADLTKNTKVTQRQIMKEFGTYGSLLRACNLERFSGGNKIKMELLFNDWANVARTLKKVPSKAEFEHLGKHSLTPLSTRFGSWGRVPEGLKNYIEQEQRTEECQDLLGIIAEFQRNRTERDWGLPQICTGNKPRLIPGRPVYGPLLRPYPAMHGPVEEQGVIYLFGTMAERLGYVVLHIQKHFPDCEALRQVDVDKWQRVIIEFEYESRNFLKHMHELDKCDIIVCWKHNWPECPLEVVELSKEIAKIAKIG
ncbi:MAG TPA: hypothetical protein VKQ89_01850 [Candidatus Angelobacter sp.]|nr:hypothetical protein [Candidatus Angelobacter sp.]